MTITTNLWWELTPIIILISTTNKGEFATEIHLLHLCQKQNEQRFLNASKKKAQNDISIWKLLDRQP